MVWARRFVKLDPVQSTIAYYASDTAAAPKKAALVVDTQSRVSRATGEFATNGPALELITSGGKSFIASVQAGDESPGRSADETIEEWVSALTSLIKNQVRISRGGAPIEEQTDPGAASATDGSLAGGREKESKSVVPESGAGSAAAGGADAGAAPHLKKKAFDPFASRVPPLEA